MDQLASGFRTYSPLGLTNLVLSHLPTDNSRRYQKMVRAVHGITADWKDLERVDGALLQKALNEANHQLKLYIDKQGQPKNQEAYDQARGVGLAFLAAYDDLQINPLAAEAMLDYRLPVFETEDLEAEDELFVVPRIKSPVPHGWLNQGEAAKALGIQYATLKPIWHELMDLAEKQIPRDHIGPATVKDFHGHEVQMVFGAHNTWYVEPLAVHGIIKDRFDALRAQQAKSVDDGQAQRKRLKVRGFTSLTTLITGHTATYARQRVSAAIQREKAAGAEPDADGVYKLRFGEMEIEAAETANGQSTTIMMLPRHARTAAKLLGSQRPEVLSELGLSPQGGAGLSL